jgi:hypothetical protein
MLRCGIAISSLLQRSINFDWHLMDNIAGNIGLTG